jgi:hypothetical protein
VYAEAVQTVAQTWAALSSGDGHSIKSSQFGDFVPPLSRYPYRYISEPSLQKLLNEMGIDLSDVSKLIGKNYRSLGEYLEDVWDGMAWTEDNTTIWHEAIPSPELT